MKPKLNFAALETMCRLKAAAAKGEMEYWLAEADEWRKQQESSEPFKGSIPIQLDWFENSNSH